MGLRSHSGLSFTCLVIQSRTEQLRAVSCRLYSLLLLPPPEIAGRLGVEPLGMMSPLSMEEEEEAGPLDDEMPEGKGGTVSVSALNSGDAVTPSRRLGGG